MTVETFGSKEKGRDMSDLTILVVDDNHMNRRLVSAMLHGRPYKLIEMASGREGLDYALANLQRLDLVLLDIGMPDVSGTDICAYIRGSSSPNASLPIIAYTAHAMAEERQRFLDAGFDDILIKPITQKELVAVLDRYLAGAARAELP